MVFSPEGSEQAQTSYLKIAGKRSERCLGAENHAFGGAGKGNQRRQPARRIFAAKPQGRGAKPRLRGLPTPISLPCPIKTPSIYGFTS